MKKFAIFLIIITIIAGLTIGVMLAIGKMNKEEEVPSVSDDAEELVNEITMGLIEVDNLNPILTNNKQVSDILKLIYEPLINIKSNNALEPCLATEWAEVDEYTWIIKLRKGVKWHDDKTFEINDVLFTINTLKQGSMASVYSSNVKNITEVSQIDENSLKIVLETPDSMLPYKLIFPILPSHYFSDVSKEDFNKNSRPVGTGAYKYLTKDEAKNKIELVANSNWWNGKIKLGKIYLNIYDTYAEAIKAFKSNKVDLLSTTLIDWERKFGTIGINTYKYESTDFEMLLPNNKNAALADNSVRRAILQAINREKIIMDVYYGSASISDIPLHKKSWLYDEAGINSVYNLEKAKQLLVNDGWKFANNTWEKTIDKKKHILKFTLIVNKDNVSRCLAADVIKENLEELGIKVTLNKIAWDTYKSYINNGTYDLALVGMDIIMDFDIISMVSDSDVNLISYSNDELLHLANSVKLSSNDVKANYNAFIQKYRSELPYIGLYFKTNVLITNKSIKGSIEPTWWNVYNNISTWYK